MPGYGVVAGIVDMGAPGQYLNWSVFTMSVSNALVILVMLVIFAAALLLPFPHSRDIVSDGDVLYGQNQPDHPSIPPTEAVPQSTMWTARLRNKGLSLLPPHKLLPDRQPAYVASWIYIFGVATLAALLMAIVSGFAIALGGADWWHTNAVGHFFNSMHLWSVELFMAFMVIHLWGKFWMAAWRGRRAATWVTGVIAFGASIVECFTGYLSQQNFDSQWISTNGKDALNAVGIGAFFNLMNFGQMLLWHVVLLPLVLVAIVGVHVLMVRIRGVVPPLPSRKSIDRTSPVSGHWTGPTRRYDIVKEAAVATAVVLVLVFVLSGLFSSPNDPPVTVATWAKAAPADFLATAASELAGTSETAQYGPPYSTGTSNVQSLLFSPQKIAGVRQPIDTANAFVLSPLSKAAPTDSALSAALATYNSASAKQRDAWDSAYLKAVDKVVFKSGRPVLPAAEDGPVPLMLSTELTLARSGALDADLLAQHPFYGTDYTKPLLFLEDGNYFSSLAKAQHLTGSQWGVMNETGSYPGQPWLWLYTLWYQLPGLRDSANVDLIAVYLTGVATIALLAIPFIPGIRAVPELVPVHRLIWRSSSSGGDSGEGEAEAPDESGN